MPKIGFLHNSYVRDAVGEKQPKTASYIFPNLDYQEFLLDPQSNS